MVIQLLVPLIRLDIVTWQIVTRASISLIFKQLFSTLSMRLVIVYHCAYCHFGLLNVTGIKASKIVLLLIKSSVLTGFVSL